MEQGDCGWGRGREDAGGGVALKQNTAQAVRNNFTMAQLSMLAGWVLTRRAEN